MSELKKMTTTPCKIVLVIDESGSMDTIKNDMIGSINSFIEDQKKLEDESTFTMVKFSDKIDIVHNNIPLSRMTRISTKDYKPNGGTALNDAMGLSMEMFKNDAKVLMVVATDGEENSSKLYKSTEDIRSSINKFIQIGWKFIYLCTDISIQKQGTDRGIYVANGSNSTTSCNNVAVGVDGIFTAFSSASQCTRAYRKQGSMPVINSKGFIQSS